MEYTQTYQILTNDDEVCISSLFSILLGFLVQNILFYSRIGPEGYLCPSQVDYVKIHRALNVEGFWRVILQHVPHDYAYGHYNYTQTTRLEACLTPDSACRLLAPCYGSKCTQKYIYHRMLSFDPCDPYRGFFIDTYKLPSACSCHIPDGPAPAPIAHNSIVAHPVLAHPIKKA